MYTAEDSTMDPRISVGQNYVYITLKDGSIWKAKRPQEGGYVDKYLYPDRSSTEYYGLAPVFGLGDDKYYFIDQNKLTVVFLPGLEEKEPTPEIILPPVESGMFRVPLRVLEKPGQKAIDHIWAKVDSPVIWNDLPPPSGFSQTGEPFYQGNGFTYNVVIDYTQTPPVATLHKTFPGEAPEKPAGGTTGLSRKTLGVEISILVFASLSLIFIAGFSKKL